MNKVAKFAEWKKKHVEYHTRMAQFFSDLKQGDIFYCRNGEEKLFRVLNFELKQGDIFLGQRLGVYLLGCSYKTGVRAYEDITLDGKCLAWKRVEVKDFPLYLHLKWHSKEFYRILSKG